jgi:RHS repeat-associated protein
VGKTSRSSADSWSYSYDTLNHLTSAVEKSDGVNVNFQVTWTYDVQGKRVQQDEKLGTGAVVTTRFAYDGENIWADLDGSNNVLARYLFGPGGIDDLQTRTVASGANMGVSAYLKDKQGSVRDLQAFASGALVDHLDYDGFGNVTESTSAAGDRYKYTAREYDTSSGLYYDRARYYGPAIGRFWSEDPTGFAAGDANLYRYVANNPTNATDPSGEAPKGVFNCTALRWAS